MANDFNPRPPRGGATGIDPKPFSYQGKAYNAYEATQKQREIERTVRRLTREQKAFEAAGLSEDAQAASIRARRLRKEYREFSAAAGLKTQPERMKVLYVDEKPAAAAQERLARKTSVRMFSSRMMREHMDGDRFDLDRAKSDYRDMLTDIPEKIEYTYSRPLKGRSTDKPTIRT